MAGASLSGDDDDQPIVGINVTPLVDVVLVLLVVFIVTARMVVADALDLDLPQAATGAEQQTVLAIELGPNGKWAVNQQPVAGLDAVEHLARAAKAEDPKLRAVIKADGDVRHRDVVGVMDRLRKLSIHRIAFGVQHAEQ